MEEQTSKYPPSRFTLRDVSSAPCLQALRIEDEGLTFLVAKDTLREDMEITITTYPRTIFHITVGPEYSASQAGGQVVKMTKGTEMEADLAVAYARGIV